MTQVILYTTVGKKFVFNLNFASHSQGAVTAKHSGDRVVFT